MTSTSSLIGHQIGNYEVQSLLGSGGMAVVYRGFDHNLQRPVAIKALSDAAASQPGITERFQREARVIAQLHHPHIVHVYDFGAAHGRAYMVQELLPGPTLAQQMLTWQTSGIRPARDDVLAIVRQVAAGLDAAHAEGVIHRDVKPSNIIRNASGAWVLTDFGIAKLLREDANLTQTGMVLGTPTYLSPEQAQGQPLTPASDLYAFGVVVYELLAGQPPFTSATPMSVLLDHIQTPPAPIRQFRPDLPVAVELVVQRALAKRPEDRHRSATDFAHALEQAWASGPATSAVTSAGIYSQPTVVWNQARRPDAEAPAVSTIPIAHAAPTSPPPSTRRLLPVLLVLLALLLGGGAFLAARSGNPPATLGAAPTSNAAMIVAPSAMNEPSATSAPSPSPSEAPEPTAASVIAPPPSEAPEPTAPPQPAGALAQLHALVEAGVADGRAGPNGSELLVILDRVEQALNANTQQGINASRIQLLLMQQQIAQGISANTIQPAFGQAALASIDAVASEYKLGLPSLLSQPEPTQPIVDQNSGDGKPGKDKDKDKDKDKGKGKDKK